MKYMNGKDILPQSLLEQLQNYVQGELLYIPRQENSRAGWDNPGMRELQLWESDSGLQDTFEDVESLSLSCRFKDCNHENEPRCAVKQAIHNGLLPAVRLESYIKLKKELRFININKKTPASMHTMLAEASGKVGDELWIIAGAIL